MFNNFFLYWACSHGCFSPWNSTLEKEEHKITEDDCSFNTYLAIVFVITVIVLLSVFVAQSAAG